MVAMTLLMTLRGTPFLYYGEELGMQNNKIKKDDIIDPAGKRFWPFYQGRDPARTPMQWSPHPNAGFTTGKSWLPVCSDYQTINIETQKDDNYSLLNLVKKLIRTRKEKPALHRGKWVRTIKGHRGVIGYYRVHEDQEIFVALNFTAREKYIHSHNRGQWKVLLSTHRSVNSHLTDFRMTLEPYEATVVEKIGTL